MPVLNNKNQISELALVNLSKSLGPTFDLATAIQKQIVFDFTPIIEATSNLQEALASSFVFSTAKVFRSFAEGQGKMFEMLRASLIQAIPVNLFVDLAPFTTQAKSVKNPSPIYEAEILEYKPEAIFGLEVTIEGRFIYEGCALRFISTNSKHGKLFRMFLVNEDNYVTDNEVRENIGVADEDRGVDFIKKDLVRYLRKDGLKAKLYRNRKEGYRLMAIKKLLN